MKSPLRPLLEAVRWHRRGLAALAAAVAVLAALSVVHPAAPASTTVVVAAANLPAGTVLSADQLRRVPLPDEALPEGAVQDVSRLVGGTLVTSVPRGQVLTPDVVLDASRKLPAGRVLVPFRLRDPALADLLRVGDVVSVVAADDSGGGAQVVAARVRVAALPRPAAGDSSWNVGGDDAKGLVVVQCDARTGAALAGAAASGGLGVTLG